MPVKRVACRYFESGSCQYGDKCRYLHVQQPPKSNIFGGSGQPQKSNPFGFGVQNNSLSKTATDKPFENKWTRPSPANATATATATASSRRSDNQPQTANHECKNPESCRSIINEDFERERPLWKLTCYGHSRNSPCDIVGDISYEELRAEAYDESKRGFNVLSIVERERDWVNAKLLEFENLRKPRAFPLNSPVSQSPFISATTNAFLQTPQNSAPPSVSSFSQFGTSLNVGLGQRPSAPASNGIFQQGLFMNPSHASSGIKTNNFPSANVGSLASHSHNSIPGNILTHNVGFGNTSVMRQDGNQSVPSQFPSATSSQPLDVSIMAEAQTPKNIQREKISGDMSIWLKEKWTPGEVPEEEPPDAVVN